MTMKQLLILLMAFAHQSNPVWMEDNGTTWATGKEEITTEKSIKTGYGWRLVSSEKFTRYIYEPPPEPKPPSTFQELKDGWVILYGMPEYGAFAEN